VGRKREPRRRSKEDGDSLGVDQRGDDVGDAVAVQVGGLHVVAATPIGRLTGERPNW
jgi:hypothetical protein